MNTYRFIAELLVHVMPLFVYCYYIYKFNRIWRDTCEDLLKHYQKQTKEYQTAVDVLYKQLNDQSVKHITDISKVYEKLLDKESQSEIKV